ncbi:MAG TPA: hypothetical protein DD490_16595 [Acidobacteria bacterium]|nr:hypothetical protein [Acidobacteriota bacterium]
MQAASPQKSTSGSEPKAAPEPAARPESGAPSGLPRFFRFPHQEQIQRSLGVSQPFQAVDNEPGCAGHGKVAFTDGAVTHFSGKEPPLDVAAHEAAHQLQHAGLTHDAGLGPEGHAVAVAAAVREGKSAKGLIGKCGDPVPSAVRGYVKTDEYGGSGKLGDTGDTLTFGSHVAYATPALIAQAASILKAKKSGIEISAGEGAMTVQVPGNGGSKTLSKVKVKHDVDPTGETFWGDCRQAAREVMGPKGSTTPEAAVCWPGGAPMEVPPNESPLDLVALTVYIDKKIRQTPGYEKMTDEEKRAIAQEAREEFLWLDKKDKEALRKTPLGEERAKELGLDLGVVPEVGEAYAVRSGKNPVPGEYFFHYATVIMAAGPDRVTFENAGGDKGSKTTAWRMETYGTVSKEQTFHDRWASKLGDNSHTIRVRTQPPPPGDADKFSAMPTRQLLDRHVKSTDESERFYLKEELEKRRLYAFVEAVQTKSWIADDQVYLLFGAGGGMVFSTGAKTFANGSSQIYEMPLSRLLPALTAGGSSSIQVQAFQMNLVLSDDFLGSIDWPAPYWPKSGVGLNNGGAQYTVSLTT